MNRRRWKKDRAKMKDKLIRRKSLEILIIILRRLNIYKPPYNHFAPGVDRYCDLKFEVKHDS